MGLNQKMAAGNSQQAMRENAMLNMYKDDKKFRADRLIEAWSHVAEVGAGLKTMPRNVARNVAINLDRQYNWMNGLKESMVSTALNNFTPENMLRLVRLSMPNLIRNKIFTEYALKNTRKNVVSVRLGR
jgi:hypothetical protein